MLLALKETYFFSGLTQRTRAIGKEVGCDGHQWSAYRMFRHSCKSRLLPTCVAWLWVHSFCVVRPLGFPNADSVSETLPWQHLVHGVLLNGGRK